MDFKRVYTSSKTYIILITVALVLLLFISGMAYKQIMRMQSSSEMVTHSFKVFNAISDLSAHFTLAQSEDFRDKIRDSNSFHTTLEKYKTDGNTIINNLNSLIIENETQKKRLKSVDTLLNILYNQLHNLGSFATEGTTMLLENSASQDISQKEKIEATLFQIRSIVKSMQAEEDYVMRQRKDSYSSYKFLAPFTSLVLTFVALFISFASFIRIYRNKIRIRKSEDFLKSILATTDNIINHYEPIFNENKEIIDFKIVFANACNRDYLGLEPNEIMNNPLSQVPTLFKMSGEFKELTQCYSKQNKNNFKQQITVNGEEMWFQVFITPLFTGVLVTARNTTAEEKAYSEQLNLKKRLEEQNLKLLDNRALLSNIFKSTSHIVMHFMSMRDEHNSIVDFKIVFVNDSINPVTGDIPDEIKNKRVSEIFPSIFNSGVFQHLVKAVETNTPQHYETTYNKNDFTHWFQATAIKLGDGVTVTTNEITLEKEKELQLLNLNEELVIQNSILSNAERLAKIGSYLWDMETGESEISDNFYHILGHQAKEFELNFEKYRAIVHPDDLEIYDKIAEEFLTTKIPKDHTYRIITKQGQVKHLKSNGQIINKNGKTLMAGVVQDVTESVKAEEDLINKNRDLLRSNAELESFNRVSSHDLQEPLRKIRLFISRIEDKDKDTLTRASSDYFDKVKIAVKRMQSLIHNLLAYSRIDNNQNEFTDVDLNDVLEKVADDLTTRIKENNASLLVDKLPTIKGLVFQMEQLFTNLISNAIKYRNPSETPIIEIKYEHIQASDISEEFTKTSKFYHKIRVIDNGIGFEPEYAEKIFEVFQRLHQKNEYSGTGIGLAICKKIIETHNGYIHAVGKPNAGAEFVIYLPA